MGNVGNMYLEHQRKKYFIDGNKKPMFV